MQENEFEKQVHEKMEGLKFQPTEAVWLGVESKLRKRKKRRYLFIWLPVYFAVLALAGYFIWPHHVPGKAEQQFSPLAKNDSPSKNYSSSNHLNNLKSGEKNAPVSDRADASTIPDSGTHAGNGILSKPRGSRADVSDGLSNEKPVARSRVIKRRNFSDEEKKHFTKQSASVQQRVPVPKNRLVESGTRNGVLLPASKPVPAQEIQNAVTRELHYTRINPELFGNGPANTASALESFSKNSQITLTRINRKKTWQVGITIHAGRSGVNTGQFNSMFRAADPASMVNYSAPSAPAANMYIPPSALKQGHAFSTGIYVKKQLSYRLAVSAGVNYALYTSSYQVGQKADTTIVPQAYVADQRQLAGIFRPGSNVKYTNRYHFLELPVLLHTKLTGRKETGLSWDVGFSISRLLSTNALFYDLPTGLYYKDRDVFNKTQWNLVTALPVSFYSSKKASLLVGPYFQYGLTKLSGETNKATHLVFFGLKAGILLK